MKRAGDFSSALFIFIHPHIYIYGIILFDLVNPDSDCAAKFYLLRSSGVACRALADAYFIPRIAPKDLYGVADVLSLRNWLRILWSRPSFHRTTPTLAFSPFSSPSSTSLRLVSVFGL